MGEIGDYWREHKEYKRDKAAAEALDMSLGSYRRWLAKERAKDKKRKIQDKLAAHTIRCECGRTFMDANAHKCHKQRWGKIGHNVVQVMTPKHKETIEVEGFLI